MGFKRYSCDVEIIDIKEICKNVFTFEMFHKEIASRARAGMFLSLLPNTETLRRPLAFMDADPEKSTFKVLFSVVGKGTKHFSSLRVGDKISINAPLGNMFLMPKDKDVEPVLLGGGSGIPPLYFLAKTLNNTGKKSNVILGARNCETLFLKEDIKKFANLYLSTDDGSEGFYGNSVELLKKLIADKSIKNPFIYACGPSPMLRALRTLMLENNINGYFSFESVMGCGFGMCQACAVERNTTNDNKKEYALCCINGPVFNFNDIKL